MLSIATAGSGASLGVTPSIRQRLFRGTALNLIAVVFTQGSTFLINVIVARVLLKEGFGQFAMVQSTLSTVVTLAQMATGYAASKHIAEYRNTDRVRAGRVMAVCSLLSAVGAGLAAILLVIAAPLLARTVLNAPQLGFPLAVGAGFLFFSAINGYQTGALAGFEAFPSLAKAGVISGILGVGSVSLGAYFGGVNGAVLGLTISALLRCSVHKVFLAKTCRENGIQPEFRNCLRLEKRVVTQFILPSAFSQCYSPPLLWLAQSFLVRLPEGYGAMALYSVANTLRILILFLPSVMNSVGVSILNNEIKGGAEHSFKVFRYNLASVLVISVLGSLAVAVFSEPLLILFGRDFSAAQPVLFLLLGSAIFESLEIALYQYFIARSLIWIQFSFIIVPREIILVGLALTLVPRWGASGLAAAYTVAHFVGFALHGLIVTLLWRRELRR